MGNMGNMPTVAGNVPMAPMQGMGRAGGLMGQRGKVGKKGKTRNVHMHHQGGPAGKRIPGATVGGSAQGGLMNSQGGKPSMGMFSQGGNPMSSNISGGKPLSGNLGASGQQWGSSNLMTGIQNSVSGNSQFGTSSSAAQSVGTGGYGATSVGGGAPAQPPPHYNAAIAQQQMIQNTSGNAPSHMSQGPRFPNAMNT